MEKIRIFLSALIILGLICTGFNPYPVNGISNVDMDNAGNHLIRDDDNSMEDQYTLDSSSDYIAKKLWIYSNDVEDADAYYLFVYGKLLDPVQAGSPTHDLFINNIKTIEFNAGDFFIPSVFRWSIFSLNYKQLFRNGCNEFKIQRHGSNTVMLVLGIDKTFKSVATNQFLGDFDRSWTNEQISTQFTGEFMIYLEIVNVDKTNSVGYQSGASGTSISICRKWQDNKADSAGLNLNFGNMDQEVFNNIQLVYFWVLCKPSGNSINPPVNFPLKILVNENIVREFAPFQELPPSRFSWLRTEIYNIQSPNTNLQKLIKGMNFIKICSDDNDENADILNIPYYDGLNQQLTWWWLKVGGVYGGGYYDPESCPKDLMMYCEVIESDKNQNPNVKVFRYGSSALDSECFSWFEYQYPQNALVDFNNVFTYGNNFLATECDVKQWTIYGEARSALEQNTGDLTDIYVHYGPGDPSRPIYPGTILLYQNNEWWIIGRPILFLIGESTAHNNDDMHDFTQIGKTLTEAEGNDEISSEDDGSDGLNFDLEWIFFFTPNLFSDDASNRLQTLLWHNAHAIFGFDLVSTTDLNEMIKVLYDYLFGITPSLSVINAFRKMCDDYDVTGHYFYKRDCDPEDIWGKIGGIQKDDSINRDTNNINFVEYNGEGGE